jgi:hypothetical protein
MEKFPKNRWMVEISMGNSQRKWMISMDFYTARNAFIQLWGSPMNSWISMGNSQEIDDFYGGRMAD